MRTDPDPSVNDAESTDEWTTTDAARVLGDGLVTTESGEFRTALRAELKALQRIGLARQRLTS